MVALLVKFGVTKRRNPDEDIVRKMWLLAKELGAHVKGEEGKPTVRMGNPSRGIGG